MKVLLVEDQLRLGQFTKKGLGESGFTVTLATTCSDASDAICETGYDVVVLDLGLPDGDTSPKPDAGSDRSPMVHPSPMPISAE